MDIPRPALDSHSAGGVQRLDSEELIETTNGRIKRKDAAQLTAIQAWVKRTKDALAAQREAEAAKDIAETNLARQRQINALALNMLSDEQLELLSQQVSQMDAESS